MPSGRSRGRSHGVAHPHAGLRRTNSSGKAKKAVLQAQRRRDAEKAAAPDEDEQPGPVRARIHTMTWRSGGRVILRLTLRSSLFAPACGPHEQPAATSAGDGGGAAQDEADRRLQRRVAQVTAALSRTSGLKPALAGPAWADACAECARVLDGAAESAAAGRGASAAACNSLFLAVQQAVQSGPMTASKAGRFGLLRKACGGVSEHPHARVAGTLLASARRAVDAGISFSENQAAGIARWNVEYAKAFPADTADSAGAGGCGPPSLRGGGGGGGGGGSGGELGCDCAYESDGESIGSCCSSDSDACGAELELMMRELFYPPSSGMHGESERQDAARS